MAVPTKGPLVNVNQGAASNEGGVHIGGDVWIFSFDAAMVDGVAGTGAGVTGPGSICGNSGDGKVYINTNTKASPTWVVAGIQT